MDVGKIRQDSIQRAGVLDEHVLGYSEDATLAIELNSVRRIGSEFDFTSLTAQPCDHLTRGSAYAKLREKEIAVSPVRPKTEFMHGVADKLLTQVSVPPLEGSVHFQESAFLKSGDRERDRAGVEYLLEFFFGHTALCLRLSEGPFRGL